MYRNRQVLQAVFLCFLLTGLSSVVFAAGSGGFRNETPDAAAFGKGSAFVGEANTPAAVFYNPAGLNQIDKLSVSFGDALIAPLQDAKPSSGGPKVQSHRRLFNIPDFYAAIPVLKNKFTLGVGTGSYFGLGSEWAADGFTRYAATKSSIKNMDTMITGTYQVTNQWALAVGADYDYSEVNESKKIFQSNPNVDDANLQLKAKDGAWGYRLATMFKINDQNQVGLMYRSPIHHKYVGKAYLDGLNNAGTTPFRAIFGDSSFETRVTEKVVLPQSVVIGYSFKPTNKWTLNADLEWMDWSSFRNEVLTFPDANGAGQQAVLTAGNPTVHDWTAAWSEAIGMEYAATDRLRLRSGYYHHQKVGPQDNFNPAVMDSGSHGITAGFGFDITSHLTFDLAYSLLIYESRKVDSAVANGTINGRYSNMTHIAMAGFTYKF